MAPQLWFRGVPTNVGPEYAPIQSAILSVVISYDFSEHFQESFQVGIFQMVEKIS